MLILGTLMDFRVLKVDFALYLPIFFCYRLLDFLYVWPNKPIFPAHVKVCPRTELLDESCHLARNGFGLNKRA